MRVIIKISYFHKDNMKKEQKIIYKYFFKFETVEHKYHVDRLSSIFDEEYPLKYIPIDIFSASNTTISTVSYFFTNRRPSWFKLFRHNIKSKYIGKLK